MVHPDRVVSEADIDKMPMVEPVYPLTEGLYPNQVRKAAEVALTRVPELPEWQDAAWLDKSGFPPFLEALASIHRPEQPTDVLPDKPGWSRLAFDEILAGQLALALVRANMRRPAGLRTAGDGRLRNKIVAALPYKLTPSQSRALTEIAGDLDQPQRMLRLLQGDV